MQSTIIRRITFNLEIRAETRMTDFQHIVDHNSSTLNELKKLS